jgi:hypothetical protein
MSVILATREAEVRRTVVRSQPRQIVHETLYQKKKKKKTHLKNRPGGGAQGIGPEFKLHTTKKKKKKKFVTYRFL